MFTARVSVHQEGIAVSSSTTVGTAVQALLQSRSGRPVTPVAGPAAAPFGNPWRTGLVSNVLNPKIAVFYTGLLPTLAPSGLSPHLGMTCWSWPRPAPSSRSLPYDVPWTASQVSS
ncbi:hypothetical protein ACIA6T_05915 [Streptomyces sp. NPDC051740]|uniref:hypothetical protein n=1 Tax=Streptomyces sp. NPDC051740 TaxID=3365673 RepID=UPI0037B14305